jgi:hypothetical protein
LEEYSETVSLFLEEYNETFFCCSGINWNYFLLPDTETTC